MIKPRQRILAACFVCLFPWAVYAAAPVVDESDNFATYDQNQAADDQPLAHDRGQTDRNDRDFSDNDFADDQPLARESKHTSSGNNASLLGQVQSMQKEIQELRGQLEVQNHELKVLKEQQLTFYKDIDARLHKAPTPPAPAQATAPPRNTKPATAGTTTPLPAASTPEKVIPVASTPTRSNYLAAYDLIKNKRFSDAIVAMQSFVTQYPNGGYTANAHYWLGELYMTQKDYSKANTQFDIVLTQFPSSSKAAPSLLKSAYALASSGKKQEAIARLKQVIKHYPDTHTAKMAEVKLKSLN
jgi:tol-pal system protein YbgF